MNIKLVALAGDIKANNIFPVAAFGRGHYRIESTNVGGVDADSRVVTVKTFEELERYTKEYVKYITDLFSGFHYDVGIGGVTELLRHLGILDYAKVPTLPRVATYLSLAEKVKSFPVASPQNNGKLYHFLPKKDSKKHLALWVMATLLGVDSSIDGRNLIERIVDKLGSQYPNMQASDITEATIGIAEPLPADDSEVAESIPTDAPRDTTINPYEELRRMSYQDTQSRYAGDPFAIFQ